MEETIRNIIKLAISGTYSEDVATKNLVRLFGLMSTTEANTEQKFAKGASVKVLSGVKPLNTTISKIDWDDLNRAWRYYFLDELGKEWFSYDNEFELI